MVWLKGVKRNPRTPEEWAVAVAYEEATADGVAFDTLAELKGSPYYVEPSVLQPAEALDTEPEVPVDLAEPRYLRHVFPSREGGSFEVGAELGERVRAWLGDREVWSFAVRESDAGSTLTCVTYPDCQKESFLL